MPAKDAVPDIKETSSVTDEKSASRQEASAEVIQNYVKPKVVEKVFDLPVVSDTYDSLVKLSSPLSPYVEKIGTLASPVVEQALEFRARIEDKVPEGIQTGYTTTLNKVSYPSIYQLKPQCYKLQGGHRGNFIGRHLVLGR